MICPLSGDTPCQDKVEYFLSQFFLSDLCRILTELKTIQPFLKVFHRLQPKNNLKKTMA